MLTAKIFHKAISTILLLAILEICVGYVLKKSVISISVANRSLFSKSKLCAGKSQLSECSTRNEIEKYGSYFGLSFNTNITGPFLRIEAFSEESVQPIGYLTAFIRPFPLGLLHLDAIKVKNHRQNLGYRRSTWKMDGHGITFIMGALALRWGLDRGCTKAELLAVRDDEKMHDILVRLYESLGFKVLREVGDDSLRSVTDRLVWGAVGTLMGLDIQSCVASWTPTLRALIQSKEKEAAQQQLQNPGEVSNGS